MKIFFVGGASQARLCYNIIRKAGHDVPLVYDCTVGLRPGWECEIFDDEAKIPERARACEGFLVCIGGEHGEARVRYSRLLLDLGLIPVSAVHPSALFGEDARIGAGVQAMMRSSVQDFAAVGDDGILTMHCVVSHDVRIGTGVHVMGSASIAGFARIGDYSTIGTNATVLPRITIGKNCLVGAGSVVTGDIPDNAVVAGVPGKILRFRDPVALPEDAQC
jgi:sugar O-acyltransferase (sialic acid O-acetyltransferase NeuD family)